MHGTPFHVNGPLPIREISPTHISAAPSRTLSAAPTLAGVSDPGRGALRVLRGASLALACTLIAVGGHVLGGGDAPPVGALLAVAALGGAAFVVLANRQRTFGQIFAAAAVSQLVFHGAFSLSAGAYGHPIHEPIASLIHPPMLTGHLLAAAAAAALVAYGERAVWALHELGRLFRLPELAVIRPVTPPRLRQATSHTENTRELLLARTRPRRGPPCCR